ncbi:prolyl oligopeptidase family serine peptidase [Winogradskyella maritima]|uniref:Alpha/beta hydrolase family protein n=1 Tax=Winogradskyella maritima TaxID=1517766 RepID=A0ABV8AEW3_9FLAO|nr:prolyl oligopeptidase family serine peptidase [Winogradskyella maritima]
MKIKCLLLCFALTGTLFAQKKVLDHKDYDIWNTIQNRTISADGSYVLYQVEKGEKDNNLKIKSSSGSLVFEHERSERGTFTYDGKYALFSVKPWKDSIVELKRKKTKKDKMPKDSLGIYNLNTKSLTKIANVKSYKMPEKWSSHIAYLLEDIKPEKKATDSSETKDEKPKDDKTKKPKKVEKDNGYHLVVRALATGKQDTIKFVKDYTFAERGKSLAYTTTGKDNDSDGGVYVLNFENNQTTELHTAKKAKYYQLSFSETGDNLGFVVDADTTKVQVRPNELYVWRKGQNQAVKHLDASSAPLGYRVSSDGSLYFSKDESKFYFGLATPPVVKDTTLIDEEIVNVEVWTYDEPTLYTVQELQVENDKKKSYYTLLDLESNNITQLATTEYPDIEIGNEGNANLALVNTNAPYEINQQWDGGTARDYTVVDVKTGATKVIARDFIGGMRLSPQAKYAYGYHMRDSTWVAVNLSNSKYMELTKGRKFYNELHDSPSNPWSYGVAGWAKDDAGIILYDRYDLWLFNPDTGKRERLTNGRPSKTVYRYLELDSEERFLPDEGQWILSQFNENTKASGFASLNLKNGNLKTLISGPYAYSRLEKARLSDDVIYSKESFEKYPEIQYSDLSFKSEKKLTNTNPQQSQYNWGTAELINWISLDGIELTGMLIKPENFDPNKKYPMIVNFYERSSDRLNRHQTPNPGRSTINYSFYASRGYVIFNPDVQYRDGYPGESAYNCVIPGVTSLIEKGFIDKDNIGVQGHSWGGYQIAYLVTETDIFKAAEAGAPVPNMISAYGGIRWWTGLSRQFQYEHTQSRIGGTPWEYPQRYIENSPIFNIDKINTPVLIMHNDADGHVPWYQGIEFFMALRRLQKPAWFLNYNEEPHWPLKMQNRKDFNIRMQQYFDYYLKGAPMPVWMKRGVPAIEKGINQGYELLDKN